MTADTLIRDQADWVTEEATGVRLMLNVRTGELYVGITEDRRIGPEWLVRPAAATAPFIQQMWLPIRNVRRLVWNA